MSFLKYIAIASVIAATLSVLIHQGAFGMYEDEIEICTFENICTIVAIDDYMDRQHANKLEENFYNNIDTYSKIQALDEECRNTFHAFCFNQAWIDLEEFLN